MKHIFVRILKPHKNRKTLFSMLYFMIVLVDYALYSEKVKVLSRAQWRIGRRPSPFL